MLESTRSQQGVVVTRDIKDKALVCRQDHADVAKAAKCLQEREADWPKYKQTCFLISKSQYWQSIPAAMAPRDARTPAPRPQDSRASGRVLGTVADTGL